MPTRLTMSQVDIQNEIESTVSGYIERIRKELRERWNKWSIDLSKNELYEVIGGLLARQVTLATQLAISPNIWNGHIAPIILRTMVDNYITLAWIFAKPEERAKEFVMYGLGQEKLTLEHLKETLRQRGEDRDLKFFIESKELWLQSQRNPDMTEVNVGSWSGENIRKMAEDVGCLDFYRHAFLPFSCATHNMWNHISRYNLQICKNPLHRYHCVPIDPDINPDIDFLYRAAKYCEKTFKLFDEKTGVKISEKSAFEELVYSLDKISTSNIEQSQK